MFDEPTTSEHFNETCVFVSQGVREKKEVLRGVQKTLNYISTLGEGRLIVGDKDKFLFESMYLYGPLTPLG